MIALGIVAKVIGLSGDLIDSILERMLKSKGPDALQASRECVQLGYSEAATLSEFTQPLLETAEADEDSASDRWSITGNEASGLGAIRGGVRFVAAYPITPATEVLEWLAGSLPKVGGVLVQAEDELASINQIIGASFGGTPSLTATSGPGLALMTESIGLSVCSEVPVVVLDVMRCGPSTGIATKSEQSDLNIALNGLHGDAPHLVLAPTSVADCVFTTQWAVHVMRLTWCLHPLRWPIACSPLNGPCTLQNHYKRPPSCCPTSPWARREQTSTGRLTSRLLQSGRYPSILKKNIIGMRLEILEFHPCQFQGRWVANTQRTDWSITWRAHLQACRETILRNSKNASAKSMTSNTGNTGRIWREVVRLQ
jgi:hypothetical protein